MKPYFSDDQVTLYHGRDVDMLRELPDGSVDCVVTSPPYYGLRDYGVDGQRGLEPSPAEYVAGLVDVFREIRRVLTDDGTCWLNVGDSYATSPTGSRGDKSMLYGNKIAAAQIGIGLDTGIPQKNLLGMPWRVAFALQDDGWWLRNAIVWAKPNAMPESVTDRLSNRYELVFLLTRSRRYWFDLDAIREPLTYPEARDGSRVFGGNNKAASLTVGSSARRTGARYGQPLERTPRGEPDGEHPNGRNPGDVWLLPTAPFPDAHFAVMPTALAARCIKAGCRPGGTVLDPYSGSGTTGLAALRQGRRYVGIDLNADYLDMSLRTRLHQGALIEEPDEADEPQLIVASTQDALFEGDPS